MARSKQQNLSRRTFLKGAGALVVASGTVVVTAGCEANQPAQQAAGASATEIPVPQQYPEVPYTPMAPPSPGTLLVFTPHEARTVEALTARILPGTPEDPGAREAGVVFYIDNFLAYHEGFPEPTYRAAPYAQVFDPANPPPEAVQWYQQQGLPLRQAQGGQNGGSQPTPTPPAAQSGQPTPTPPSAQSGQPTTAPTAAGSQGAQIAPSATAVLTGQLAPTAGAQPAGNAGAQLAPTATAVLTGQLAPTAVGDQAGQNGQSAQPGAGAAQGGTAAPAASSPAPYQVIWVPGDQVERYGYQSILTPREVYRIGVASVDRYANAKFGKNFVDLSEQQQDTIVDDMVQGRATSFDPALSGQAFFHNLRRHTSEAMFSDPVYGGNRDMIGWKLVGYPGAQRAYSPDEIRTEGLSARRAPQDIMQLHQFNPGQGANPHVILPVSGSDPYRQVPGPLVNNNRDRLP